MSSVVSPHDQRVTSLDGSVTVVSVWRWQEKGETSLSPRTEQLRQDPSLHEGRAIVVHVMGLQACVSLPLQLIYGQHRETHVSIKENKADYKTTKVSWYCHYFLHVFLRV